MIFVSRDTCTCGCSDTAAKQRCLDSGRGWAEASCSCHCSAPQLACSVGLVWSNVTCTCLPEESVIHLEPEDTRAPRSGTALDSLLSWQMVTIIVLLVLIFALIVTIFALISKLQAAKRRIKTAKIQVSQIVLSEIKWRQNFSKFMFPGICKKPSEPGQW